MAWRLDHLFVACAPGAPELERLEAAGFAAGGGRRHVGQGTENRCVYFDNGYLELLWLVDRDEAHSAAVRDTGLAERLTGAGHPAGICLDAPPPGAPDPFPTWAYRPPYLPAEAHIPVAAPPSLDAPLVFLRPPAFGAPAYAGGAHTNGARRIRHVTLGQPEGPARHPAVAALAELDGFTVERAPAPQVILHVDAPGVDVAVTSALRVTGA